MLRFAPFGADEEGEPEADRQYAHEHGLENENKREQGVQGLGGFRQVGVL